MENIIIVAVRNNYGTKAIYPKCEKAKLFAAIAGTKTLTQANINNIKALGYTVKVTPDGWDTL